MVAKVKTQKMLAFATGPVCSFPGCNHNFIETEGVAEAAHIYGEKKGSARYIEDMTEMERNSRENLIYLCPNHHREIDKLENESKYSPEFLIKIKKDHESKISKFAEAISEPISQEIYNMAKAMVNLSDSIEDESLDFNVIETQKKVKLNNLSINTYKLIKNISLATSKDVSEALRNMTKENPSFSRKLKATFSKKYYEYVCEGLEGDELFDRMLDYSENAGQAKTKYEEAACHGIVIYLFTICEIFEK
jgi:hypothetical protein